MLRRIRLPIRILPRRNPLLPRTLLPHPPHRNQTGGQRSFASAFPLRPLLRLSLRCLRILPPHRSPLCHPHPPPVRILPRRIRPIPLPHLFQMRRRPRHIRLPILLPRRNPLLRLVRPLQRNQTDGQRSLALVFPLRPPPLLPRPRIPAHLPGHTLRFRHMYPQRQFSVSIPHPAPVFPSRQHPALRPQAPVHARSHGLRCPARFQTFWFPPVPK